MTAQTVSERQAAFVKRQKKQGLKLIRAWGHKDDEAKVKAYVAKLNKQRGVSPSKQTTA